jgi:ribosomal protein S20
MKKKSPFKAVKQNHRNRVLNRTYAGKIKLFSKLLKKEILSKKKKTFSLERFAKSFELFSKLTSLLDKTCKKKRSHLNRSKKKKSFFQKLLSHWLLSGSPF